MNWQPFHDGFRNDKDDLAHLEHKADLLSWHIDGLLQINGEDTSIDGEGNKFEILYSNLHKGAKDAGDTCVMLYKWDKWVETMWYLLNYYEGGYYEIVIRDKDKKAFELFIEQILIDVEKRKGITA